MQIKAAIVKIHIFFHIFATTHANVTQMVSKCMFTWSNSTLDALKIIIYVDNDNNNYFNLIFLNNRDHFAMLARVLDNSICVCQCEKICIKHQPYIL